MVSVIARPRIESIRVRALGKVPKSIRTRKAVA